LNRLVYDRRKRLPYRCFRSLRFELRLLTMTDHWDHTDPPRDVAAARFHGRDLGPITFFYFASNQIVKDLRT